MSADDLSLSQTQNQALVTAALEYAQKGVPVFPCRPNKRPWTEHGFQDATTSTEQIKSWWNRWPDALIGVPTGIKFSVLDLDVKNGKNGMARVPNWSERSPVSSRTQSAGAHVYFAPEGAPHCTSDHPALGVGVDTRGVGGYVIVPPSAGYTWTNGSLLEHLDRLPSWPDDLRVPSRDHHVSGEQAQADLALIAAAAAVIPPADHGRDRRVKIGMSIHSGTNGSEEGFNIWWEWLARGGAVHERQAAKRWRGFRPHSIGIGTLFREATEANPSWSHPFDKLEMEKANAVNEEWSGRSSEEWFKLLGIEPSVMVQGGLAQEQKPPPRQQERPAEPPRPVIVSSQTFVGNFVPPDYLIDGLIQRQFVYSMTGLTGAGKTAVALRIAAHVAQGLSLAGREIERGKVLYFAGENPDDVRMRWIKLAEEMNIDPTSEQIFWREGRMGLTEYRTELPRALLQETTAAGPFSLIIIDTAAAYFDGKDENDNVQAGAFARKLRSLKEISGGPTVLVTTHPPKYAGPENLLPRGGGAFLNEMDGNLTCAKREKVSELHWLGKFRGPDFAPIPFLLQPGTSERLKDSKGRAVWTVTARPLGADEKAAQDAAGARNENRVLKLLTTNPGYSIGDMAKALGWLYSNGEPDKSRAYRALKTLEDDRLVKKKGGSYEPTKAGREKAVLLPEDCETTEVAF